MKKNSRIGLALITALILAAAMPCGVFAADEAKETIKMAGTFWALVPPVIAIALALITKEVYSSLFVGIVVGGLLASSFSPLDTIDSIINNGLIEAVCLPEKRFVWAVQWHPEFSFRVDAHSRKIFGAFVAAAKGL